MLFIGLYLGVPVAPACLLSLGVPPSLGVQQDPAVRAHLSLHGVLADLVDLEEASFFSDRTNVAMLNENLNFF